MMRVCHLDTCPVGIATQNPDLRKKFTGRAEHVVNFFMFIAEEIREYLAELGYRSIDEVIGRADLLRQRTDREFVENNPRAAQLDLSPIFSTARSKFFPDQARKCTTAQNHFLDDVLDHTIVADAAPACAGSGRAVEESYPIRNTNRSVGALSGGVVTRASGANGLDDDAVTLTFTGCAGNSFGAFVPHGMTLDLVGEANDFVGKGLSGGRIIVRPTADAPQQLDLGEPDIIAGNVTGFGATSGELFIAGVAGERFCVRNSGATAVVHGIGNHGCEYMTGGRVVVLGEIGDNFGAGMSGGIAYLAPIDDEATLARKVNPGQVDISGVDEEDIEFLTRIFADHERYTGAQVPYAPQDMIKIMPRDYRKVLDIIDLARRTGRDEAEAIMEAVR